MSQTITEDTAALLEGRYQLLDCIGSGGMASVYRAVDVLLGRSVAIKMVRSELEGAALRSARSETAVLASLSHPSLVTLFDAHLAPSAPEYLVMELVDGPTLGDHLRRGPLTTTEAAHLAAELADALHVVHEAGIVHRDVKPSNVLLAPSSTPGRTFRAKLADFGVAFLLGEARVTTPGMVIGTLGYLAPEQLRGEPPTPASDVYSLGLVLLEALTGRRVFPAHGSAEALATRRTGPIEIPDAVPDEWAGLLRRMTHDDPAVRPTALAVAGEAQGLATRPQQLIDASPTPAAGTSTTAVLPLTGVAPDHDAATRRERRRRAAALIAGAAAVAAIVTGLWAGAAADAPTATRLLPLDGAPMKLEQPAVLAPEDSAPADGATEPAVVQPPANDDAEKAAEEQLKDDQKAAQEVQKEADKRAEEAQKEADKRAKEAQKAADKRAEEAEKQGKGNGKNDD